MMPDSIELLRKVTAMRMLQIRFKSILVLSIVSILTGLLTSRCLQAGIQSFFDLEYCCEHAELILIGELDSENEFTVTDVLNSTRMDFPPMNFSNQKAYEAFSDAMEKPGKIEILAFVDKQGVPVLGVGSLLGLRGDDVFLVHHSLQMGLLVGDSAIPGKHPRLKRDALISATKMVWNSTQRRKEIEKMPPSAERGIAIWKFLFKFDREFGEFGVPVTFRDFQLDRFAGKMNSSREFYRMSKENPEGVQQQEDSFFRTLDAADDVQQQMKIMKLLTMIMISEKGFDRVLKWTSEENDDRLREMAFIALVCIDYSRATDLLCENLTHDNPDTVVLLKAFRGRNDATGNWQRSRKFVVAIERLSTKQLAMLEKGEMPSTHSLNDLIVNAIVDNFHPKLIAPLNNWAHSKFDSRQIAEYSRKTWELDRVEMEPLRQEYQLTEPQGISHWLAAFDKANAPTKIVLNQLWLFEQPIDGESLLEIAKQKDHKLRQAALDTLSKLWDLDRLTNDAKKKVVETFVEVKLVELEQAGIARGVRELRVEATSEFVFPESAWFECNCSIAIGKPATPGDTWDVKQLNSDAVMVLGTRGGGVNKGEPEANAVVRLRQVDRRNQQTEWQAELELGPIKLQESEKYRVEKEK